jgi:hypothetical protein
MDGIIAWASSTPLLSDPVGTGVPEPLSVGSPRRPLAGNWTPKNCLLCLAGLIVEGGPVVARPGYDTPAVFRRAR